MAATAAWVRPTVFAGAEPERRALRDWLAAHDRPRSVPLGGRRRRPRLPLRQLHTALATDPEPIPEDERAFWAERGVGALALHEPPAGSR